MVTFNECNVLYSVVKRRGFRDRNCVTYRKIFIPIHASGSKEVKPGAVWMSCQSMLEITTKSEEHLCVVCSSEFEHLDKIIDTTEAFLAPHIKDDDFAYKIVLLLSEAVTNAIEHGNGLDASKKVRVDLIIGKERASLTVEDEGKGFEREAVQNPTDRENLLIDGGRGIFFIEQMADDVAYELNGRRVHITFNR